MHSVADVPTWMGVLMFLVGLGITIAMGKWAVIRERRRNATTSRS